MYTWLLIFGNWNPIFHKNDVIDGGRSPDSHMGLGHNRGKQWPLVWAPKLDHLGTSSWLCDFEHITLSSCARFLARKVGIIVPPTWTCCGVYVTYTGSLLLLISMRTWSEVQCRPSHLASSLFFSFVTEANL